MSDNVQLPALGESVTEGTVTRWLKKVGDTVEVDEPLLEVSTDKVDTEIPSPIAGVLEEILVAGGRDRRGRRHRSPSSAPVRVRPRGAPPRPRPPRPPPRRRRPSEAPAEEPAAEAAPRGAARRGARGARRSARCRRPGDGPARSHAPRAGRVRHRGHRHPLAQGVGDTSRSTSRCSRSPPTRSTPRSRRRSPARCRRSCVAGGRDRRGRLPCSPSSAPALQPAAAPQQPAPAAGEGAGAGPRAGARARPPAAEQEAPAAPAPVPATPTPAPVPATPAPAAARPPRHRRCPAPT